MADSTTAVLSASDDDPNGSQASSAASLKTSETLSQPGPHGPRRLHAEEGM